MSQSHAAAFPGRTGTGVLGRRVLAGVLGGLAGGLAFGAIMAATGMLPMVASLVGSSSPWAGSASTWSSAC